MERVGNLTQYEALALGHGVNVSDGHPRQSLTPTQKRIIASMPALFQRGATEDLKELEASAQRALLWPLGQASAPIGTGRIMSLYASSVAMVVVSRLLAERGGSVGLIHPTFDNIPDLMRSAGIQLVPLGEDELLQGHPRKLGRIRHLFVTTPNNPTGTVLDREELSALATLCARRGITLVIDACFRGFDTRAQFDTYAVLEASGVDYAVIEDTGKLWPVLELKLGFLAVSESLRASTSDAVSDVLLSVSPLLLVLVRELARDGEHGGYRQLHELIANNRAILTEALAPAAPARVMDAGARVSVARVRLPLRVSANRLWSELARRGVHVLPGDSFHWANPVEGDRFVRVALARESLVVSRAASVLAEQLCWTKPRPVCRARLSRRAAAGFCDAPLPSRLAARRSVRGG